MNDITQEVTRHAAREEEIRKILMESFLVNEKSNADYRATGELAVDCGIRLFSVLLNLRKPNTGLNHRATMEMLVGLNGNPFWAQKGAWLMPLMHSAAQAQADYALFLLDKSSKPNVTANDELIAQCKFMCLEVFTALLYLLGGYELMAMKSIELKKRLAPYFMD